MVSIVTTACFKLLSRAVVHDFNGYSNKLTLFIDVFESKVDRKKDKIRLKIARTRDQF
jgi:hypothetical protein